MTNVEREKADENADSRKQKKGTYGTAIQKYIRLGKILELPA